jgi:hypothetical protein
MSLYGPEEILEERQQIDESILHRLTLGEPVPVIECRRRPSTFPSHLMRIVESNSADVCGVEIGEAVGDPAGMCIRYWDIRDIDLEPRPVFIDVANFIYAKEKFLNVVFS